MWKKQTCHIGIEVDNMRGMADEVASRTDLYAC